VPNHFLKRPGLFAVRAILENATGGWGKFSNLVITTPGVRNRRDFAAYLRLLEKLGWLEPKEMKLPNGRGSWKTWRLYETTEKGRAFLDLFPKEFTN
jgi:hypothetical protein